MQHVIETIWRRGTAHVDGPLLIAVSLLLAVSLATLYSASNQSLDRMQNMLFNLGVALTVMWVVANTPMTQVMRLALPAYLLALALLVAVALFGDVRNGARRWLDLGVISIQPSELMKISLPLALAWYFDRYESALKAIGEQGARQSVPVKIAPMAPGEREKWARTMPNIAGDWTKANASRGPAAQIVKTWMEELRKRGAKPLRDWDKEL